MPGLKVVIPTTLTDNTLPVVNDDLILTTGSLLLVDMIHSANPLAAGVPADQAALPNIAWKQAAAMIGSGTATSLVGSINIKGGITNGVKGKIERTAKGGIHAIASQATALASGDGFSMTPALAIKNYIAANNAHQFYISVWDRLTRANAGVLNNDAAEYEFLNGSTTQNNIVLMVRAIGGVSQYGGSVPSSRSSPDLNTSLGNRFISALVSTPSYNASAANNPNFGGVVGAPPSSYNSAVLSSRNNYWPSIAFYRTYIEDLTVSGRTYAQVDALEYARFVADMNTVGGRYYGDTIPTAPSTIA